MRTIRETTAVMNGCLVGGFTAPRFTVPAGAELTPVGDRWALSSIDLVTRLCGNRFDAVHLWAFVPSEDCGE